MPSVGDLCWRRGGVAYLSLPNRVRLADGTTRTDPEQWSRDESIMEELGWIQSTLTQQDIDALSPPAPPPNEYELGYDTGLGWRLAWQPDDVALLTGLYVLAQRSIELGVEQPVVVTDMDGQTHSLSYSEFEPLMLSYGAARAALSAGQSSNVT